jgi:predicted GNAT family N-acyltransferase
MRSPTSLADGLEDGSAARVHLLGARDPIHGTVTPADVRPGDPISARVRTAGATDEGAAAPVWRISPLGVELVRTAPLGAVSAGDAVDVTLRVGTSVSSFSGLRVAAIRSDRGRELVALRWASSGGADEGANRGERRDAARWSCGDEYLPTGVMQSSVRYDEHVHFRIVEISRSGMQLLTSLRNKYLIPGVRFEATCAFPAVGEVRIEIAVANARVVQRGGKSQLVLGATYEVLDRRGRERIAQYLLRFGPGTSVRDLRTNGFELRCTSRAFDFGCVRTDAEYREVLALRRLAYLHAGKLGPEARDEDMADAFDAQSRILVARHQGRVVATVRLMFPQGPDDALKHAEYLELPETMPARDRLVEVSKACTHPDFRGSDLFYSMMKLTALTTAQSGREFIFMSCTDGLVTIYRKLGMRELGAGYVHPTMGLTHHVMIGDAARMIAGDGMNPIFWNVVIGHDLWQFAKRCGAVSWSAALTVRVAVRRLFAPFGFLAALYVRSLRARSGR